MESTLSEQDEQVIKKSGMAGLIQWANFPVHTWTVQVMVIFAGSIYGGIAAFFMFTAVGFSVPQLSVLLLCTVIPNALAIGQVPMKTMIPAFFAALAINTIMILINVVIMLQ